MTRDRETPQEAPEGFFDRPGKGIVMADSTMEKWFEITRRMAPELDPQKTALLIIDMQQYQVRKDWALYKYYDSFLPGVLDYFMDRTARVAEPNIQRLVEVFRAKDMRIVYTRFSSFCEDGSDLTKFFQTHNTITRDRYGDSCIPYQGAPSAQIISSLQPRDQDLVVVKNTSSVFVSTHLDRHLRHMGITQLMVAGVVTNMCVEGAARTAAELGFYVYIIEDACAAWSPEVHEGTLRSFQTIFGWVIDTDEAIRRIEKRC